MKRNMSEGVITRSKLLMKAVTMPPLSHWPDRTKPFDYRNSDVCKWLLEQLETWAWIFLKMHDTGAIVFDESSKKWAGIETTEGAKVVALRKIREG